MTKLTKKAKSYKNTPPMFNVILKLNLGIN